MVQDPTRWCVSYARRIDKEVKIKRSAFWYNKNGRLRQQIRVEDIIGPLSWLETGECMTLFKDLMAKSSQINDPTAWLTNSARKWHAAQQERSAAGATGGKGGH